jgi:hypothetical protein
MAFLQTTYSEAMPIGTVGARANSEEWNTITRTADGAIGYGNPVLRTGDHTVAEAAAVTLTGAGAAVAGNTGAATITAAPAVAAGTPIGIYKLTAVSAGATAEFLFSNPDGVELGNVTTGTTATIAGIGPFTITDAGTDPAVGDQFTITVTSNAAGDMLGLAERDITTDPANSDSFVQYDNVPVMTMGVMWVLAGATVVAGGDVYWNPSTKRFTSTTTHIRVPGAKFDTGGGNGALVKVAIR